MTSTLQVTYPDHPWAFVDPDGVCWPTYSCYIEWCRSIKPGVARTGKQDFMSVWLSRPQLRSDAEAHQHGTGAAVAGAATTIAPTQATGHGAPPPAAYGATAQQVAGPAAALDPMATMLADREQQHGDFTDHARCAVALKTVFDTEVRNRIHRGQDDLTPTQLEASHMILHKLARIVAGDPNHDDHWRDIAGYATITADRIQR